MPEEAVTASAIIHIDGGPGADDADLINQTISPELLSSLLRSSFDDVDDDASDDTTTEQFLRDAADSLNQIDQPVTLSQLKNSRSRFRLLKRKEKPFLTRELAKDSLKETLIDETAAAPTRKVSSSKMEPTAPQHTNGTLVDSQEMKKFSSTKEEGPVGSSVRNSPKLLQFAKTKKDKVYNIPSFRNGSKPPRDGKEPVSDESLQSPSKHIKAHHGGCCILSWYMG